MVILVITTLILYSNMSIVLKTVTVFIILEFMSCVVPNRIKRNINLCYEKKATTINSVFNVNGYYQMTRTWERDERYSKKGEWVHKIDTLYTNILFYNDGTVVYEFNDDDMERDDAKIYLEELANRQKIKNGLSINARFFGLYDVISDTIKIQILNNPGLTNTWIALEKWFLIKDRNTIELIATRRLDKQINNNTCSSVTFFEIDDRFSAHFIPLQTIPSANSWTKRKAWLWCDKKEYNNYKVRSTCSILN